MPQAEPAPRRRHKSRPTFEVPEETSVQEAPVGWVYREKVNASDEAARPQHKSPDNPLAMVATGLILVGAGSVGIISLTAFGLITTPIRLVNTILTRRL